jgi:hypothetical protein
VREKDRGLLIQLLLSVKGVCGYFFCFGGIRSAGEGEGEMWKDAIPRLARVQGKV